MIEFSYKVVGTLLLGGILINYFMPIIGLLMLGMENEAGEAKMFWQISGKIHRKWYFFNGIIISILLFVLAFLTFLLSNWIFTIIAIPYFLILFFLLINNSYKRLYAITDNHKLAIIISPIYIIGMNMFGLFKENYLYGNVLLSCIYFIFVIFAFVLLFVKTKQIKKVDTSELVKGL